MNRVFHSGEIEIQRRAGLREMAEQVGRILATELSAAMIRVLPQQRLAVAASVSADGGVRASLLSGSPGFLEAADEHLVRVSLDLLSDDPLALDLAARPELGLLVFDPTRRTRIRLNGRALLSPEGLFLLVDQAYGNCTKYIQLRRLVATDEPVAAATARLSSELDAVQRATIESADTFFIASLHPEVGADVSHRGGSPGFVRFVAPDRLRFPNYPGNAMFNTLGNLLANPRAGLLFVDFARGATLQLAGTTTIDDDLVVEFHVDAVRELDAATRLRFELVEPSPAHPRLSRSAGSGISRTDVSNQPGRDSK